MQKNSDNFSIEDAIRLANSPAGKQLMALLQNADPAAVSKARSQASSGEYSQLMQTMAPLLESQEAKALLKQLGG